MQLTLHATRRAPHGASRLVIAMSTWSVKTRRLCPGIVGMQGSMVRRLRPCMILSNPPPACRHTVPHVMSAPPSSALHYRGVAWSRGCVRFCCVGRPATNRGRRRVLPWFVVEEVLQVDSADRQRPFRGVGHGGRRGGIRFQQ